MLRAAAPIALLVLSACGGGSASIPVNTRVPVAAAAQTPTSSPSNVETPAGTDTRISNGTANNTTTTNKALTQPVTAPQPAPPTSTPNSTFAPLINGVRDAAGVGNVSYDARLGSAAQNYAETLLRENRFSHVGSDGSTLGTRATAAGYQWRTIGENIAQGYTSQQSVLNGWQNSPGHRANNENPNFEDFGLGIAGSGGQTRWVLMFGAER